MIPCERSIHRVSRRSAGAHRRCRRSPAAHAGSFLLRNTVGIVIGGVSVDGVDVTPTRGCVSRDVSAGRSLLISEISRCVTTTGGAGSARLVDAISTQTR